MKELTDTLDTALHVGKNQKEIKEKVCILILGMHRSGTSALSRTLNLLGYTLPDRLIPAGEGNEGGHWEPQNIVIFNERLLEDMQSEWASFCTPAVSSLSPADRKHAEIQVAEMLQQEYGGAQNIVLKDPRLCQFEALYSRELEALGYRVVPIIAVRNPVEVVKSLQRRGSWPTGFGSSQAVLIWLRHFLDAEFSTRGKQRTFIDFTSLMNGWQSEIQRVSKQGGFSYPEDIAETAPLIEEFLRPDLRNQKARSDDFSGQPLLRGWCMKAYDAAKRLTVNPHSSTAQNALDEVRSQFGSAELFLSDFSDESFKSIEKLSRQQSHTEENVKRLQEAYNNTHKEMVTAKQRVEGQDRQVREISEKLVANQQRVEGQDRQLKELNGQLRNRNKDMEEYISEAKRLENNFLNSRSWKLTRPLRAVGSTARKIRNTLRAFRRASHAKGGLVLGSATALRILVTEGRSGLRKRLHNRVLVEKLPSADISLHEDPRLCYIAATPHVIDLAKMMGRILREEGFIVDIGTDLDGADKAEHVFVLCPQMFESVPENYIAVQMEQSVNSRWFETDYLDTLKRAHAVIDYSMINISFLQEQGIPLYKTFYVPIDVDRSVLVDDGTQREGILFYGDDKTPRRQQILEAVAEAFPKLRILNNLFGDELEKEIRNAAVVLNIHYYEGALLETTRIYQALSYGTPVVSEVASDQDEHGHLEGIVDFAPVDDVDALIELLRKYVDGRKKKQAALQRQKIAEFANRDQNRFEDFFRRFLLAQNMIGYDAFNVSAPEYPFVPEEDAKLCLSMPETPDRRLRFLSQNRSEFKIWDGLKTNPGWVGAASSYRHMFKRLLESGAERATVCEDDVLFPEDFDARMETIEQYLAQCEWDVFSGFIADAHMDINITHVEEFEGLTFVHIDRTVSMVFNIYNREIMQFLSAWDPDNRDVETNTIDRYLENRDGTKVVVALPYLVRHCPDSTSTVWGFENTQYEKVIEESEKVLTEKVEAYRRASVKALPSMK